MLNKWIIITIFVMIAAVNCYLSYWIYHEGTIFFWRHGFGHYQRVLVQIILTLFCGAVALSSMGLLRKLVNPPIQGISQYTVVFITLISFISVNILFFYSMPLFLQESNRKEAQLFSLVGRPRADFVVKNYNPSSLEFQPMLLSSFKSNIPFVMLDSDGTAYILHGSAVVNNSPILLPQYNINVKEVFKVSWRIDADKLCLESICFTIDPNNGVLKNSKPVFRIEQVGDSEIHWPYMGGGFSGVEEKNIRAQSKAVDSATLKEIIQDTSIIDFSALSSRIY